MLYWFRISDYRGLGIFILTTFLNNFGAGHLSSTHWETLSSYLLSKPSWLAGASLLQFSIFLPSYCKAKYVCIYTSCSSSFGKSLAFVFGLYPAVHVLLPQVQPGHLKLKLYFLHKFTVLALDSLSCTDTAAKWIWLLQCVLGVCLGPSPLYSLSHVTLTPEPLCVSYFASGALDLIAILVFFLFNSNFL